MYNNSRDRERIAAPWICRWNMYSVHITRRLMIPSNVSKGGVLFLTIMNYVHVSVSQSQRCWCRINSQLFQTCQAHIVRKSSQKYVQHICVVWWKVMITPSFGWTGWFEEKFTYWSMIIVIVSRKAIELWSVNSCAYCICTTTKGAVLRIVSVPPQRGCVPSVLCTAQIKYNLRECGALIATPWIWRLSTPTKRVQRRQQKKLLKC